MSGRAHPHPYPPATHTNAHPYPNPKAHPHTANPPPPSATWRRSRRNWLPTSQPQRGANSTRRPPRSTHTHTHTHARTHARMHANTWTLPHVCAPTHTHTHPSIHQPTHTHTHIHTRTNTSIGAPHGSEPLGRCGAPTPCRHARGRAAGGERRLAGAAVQDTRNRNLVHGDLGLQGRPLREHLEHLEQ